MNFSNHLVEAWVSLVDENWRENWHTSCQYSLRQAQDTLRPKLPTID